MRGVSHQVPRAVRRQGQRLRRPRRRRRPPVRGPPRPGGPVDDHELLDHAKPLRVRLQWGLLLGVLAGDDELHPLGKRRGRDR